jgi:hypothetical protein
MRERSRVPRLGLLVTLTLTLTVAACPSTARDSNHSVRLEQIRELITRCRT